MLRIALRVPMDFNFPWNVQWPVKIPVLAESSLEWCRRDELVWPGSPPLGNCFQLWCIFNDEASVASPIFDTLEELADWCSENKSIFGGLKGTKSEWMSELRQEDCEKDLSNRETVAREKRIFSPEDRKNYLLWCDRLLSIPEVSAVTSNLQIIFGANE